VRSTHGNSFDYLVGAGEQGRRHLEAERLRGGQIDNQLELGRLLDRKVGRAGDACVETPSSSPPMSQMGQTRSSDDAISLMKSRRLMQPPGNSRH
jgi:hypothetical protein